VDRDDEPVDPPRPVLTPRPPNPARYAALAALLGVVVVFLLIVLGGGGGSGPQTTKQSATSKAPKTTSTAAKQPGTQAVPILTYNVINSRPSGSSAPSSLYVPADEFSAQMQALKHAGWHAVTLDQLLAYWTHGTALGSGKPIVISFDGGYASQYTSAFPVLKHLGWPGVLNVPATLLPPSEGGISDSQVAALRKAGWELGLQAATSPDLTTLSSAQGASEVQTQRQTVSTTYGATPNWLAYAAGHYNANATAAARTAGFAGALTLSAGWASPKADRYLLPRIAVVPGTTPSQLLSQINAAKSTTSAPSSA
jgi:peptidoglycan/xylan/chitin deacetylase (PgdA/CDA1 family)